MTIQPHVARLHSTVKLERTCPYIGIARIGLVDFWQHQDSVTLFDQAHTASEGATRQRVGKVLRGDIVVVVMALYPCGSIVKEDIGSSPLTDTDCHISRLSHEQLLVILRRGDAATVGNLRTVSHGQSRGCHGDAL